MDIDVAAGADCTDESTTLLQLRNMWQFANFCQWLYIFGKAAKIEDSIDVETIEAECLKHDSPLLADLALSILKLFSSHRGLTYEFQVLLLPCLIYRLEAQTEQVTSHDKLDDELRKQYRSRDPANTIFGNSDSPPKFSDFNMFIKIQILQQLTQWTMAYSERLRDRMEEQKDYDQTSWRIEPYGWDQEDHTYFVLDDNRVYRLTEPHSQPRQKTLKKVRRVKRSATRKRRQAARPSRDSPLQNFQSEHADLRNNGLGGKKWECIAVTLQEAQQLLENMENTRDENEKILRQQLETHLLPILEKQDKNNKRKQAQKKRELLNMAKIVNAKRSSRIACKAEKQKQEERERKEEQQHKELEAIRLREERNRLAMEGEREFRMLSRQRRLQEREACRQHMEEMGQMSQGHRTQSPSTGRVSQGCLEVDLSRNKEALGNIKHEEDWVFDCVCGMYGQVDDGTHSVACERCNVWQHSQCLGIKELEADQNDFHFVCVSCRRHDLDGHVKQNVIAKVESNSLFKAHPGIDEQIHATQITEAVADIDASPGNCSSYDTSSSMARASGRNA